MNCRDLEIASGYTITIQVDEDGFWFAWASDDDASSDVIRTRTVATATGKDAETCLAWLAKELGVQ